MVKITPPTNHTHHTEDMFKPLLYIRNLFLVYSNIILKRGVCIELNI